MQPACPAVAGALLAAVVATSCYCDAGAISIATHQAAPASEAGATEAAPLQRQQRQQRQVQNSRCGGPSGKSLTPKAKRAPFLSRSFSWQ